MTDANRPPRPLQRRLAERAEHDDRPLREQTEPLVKSHVSLRIDRADELTVAAVGAMVLQHVATHGQTRVYARAIENLLARATDALTSQEVMQLEVEAYEVVDWLLGPDRAPADAHPEPAATRKNGVVLYDPNASVYELIERAIAEDFEVVIDYFSRRRGEMNTRRIRPRRIDAETYVAAWCYARRADRVFRLQRITRCVPVRGRPVDPAGRLVPAREEKDVHADGSTPLQMSLLEE